MPHNTVIYCRTSCFHKSYEMLSYEAYVSIMWVPLQNFENVSCRPLIKNVDVTQSIIFQIKIGRRVLSVMN